MTIGYSREIALDQLTKILFYGDEGIVLASHTDAGVIHFLKQRNTKLFFVDCTEEGLPLDEVERIIEQQKDTDVPIRWIGFLKRTSSYHTLFCFECQE